MGQRFTNFLPKNIAATLLNSEDGNTAVEYALMLGVICGVMLTSVRMLGNSTVGTLTQIAQSLRPEPEFSTQQQTIQAPTAVSVSLSPKSP
jgi:Flp pilus assembly pilin Flp